MEGKKIAIVGLGALGAPAAIELARSGASALNLMDPEILEPGNSVRWPLGLSFAGHSKTGALAEFIRDHYPRTQVTSFNQRFGAPRSLAGPTPAEYDHFFQQINLLLDCTAEVGTHYPIAKLARERGIPYIAISGTPGLWGGRVVRVSPKSIDGCWICFCRWLREGKLPSPPSNPEGEIRGPGCSNTTFTGANYNAIQISSFGVRFAVDCLRPTPEFDFDLSNVAFNNAEGRNIAPVWTTYKLERHPTCPNH